MTVVISDLVARLRAEGAEQTTQQVKAVGAAAEQTARALQIMAEAAAKQGGGTAGGWLEVFSKGNVQPTAAAMAQAAQEMQKATAATQQAVAPTQNLARASVEHAAGWRLSESSIVRFGTALVGVNLGISLIAGSARQIHEELLAAVEAARDLQIATRAAAGAYGPGAARGIGPGATAFTDDPTTRGTQSQYIQAVAGLRSLTTEYGLSLIQVQQLVTASGQLARIQGTDLPTAAGALGEVMRGNLSAANQLGISLTDQAGRIRGLNATYDELVTISGRTRAEQVLFQTTMGAVQTQLDNTKTSTRNLADALEDLGKAAQNARQAAGNALAGPATRLVDLATGVLTPPRPTAQDYEFLDQSRGLAPGTSQSQRIAGARAMELAMQSERSELIQATQATQQNTSAVVAQTTAYERARLAIDHTVEALGRVRAEQGQFAALAEAARGPLFPLLPGSAEAGGAAQAAQDELAIRQQRIAQGSADQMRRQLEQAVTVAGDIGPNATARAQQDLAAYDARAAIRTQQIRAQQQAAQIDLQTAQTQAQLEQISLQQRQRYVQLMRETVDLRMLDNAQQQRGIQAQMELTRAQQAALPAQRIASQAQYQQALAQALAQQRMARLLQGQDVSQLPSLNDLINQNYQGQLIGAENAPALVQANRGVEVAGQNVTIASLDQSLTESNLHLKELQNDAANLRDIPQQTQLQLELIQNNRDQLSVQQEQRELLKALVYYLSQAPPSPQAGQVADRDDRISRQVVNVLTQPASPPAPSELPGARRGPF